TTAATRPWTRRASIPRAWRWSATSACTTWAPCSGCRACSASSIPPEALAAGMSAQIDFLALYRELGIDPTCSREAFKHAYRRRVSELHPDRGSEGHAGEEALKVLNLGYAAALEFFQAHGRFPGAPPAPAAARRPAPAPSAGAAATARPPRRGAGTAPPAGVAASATTAPGQRRWLSGVLVALVALVLAAQLAGRGDEGTAAPADPARAGAAAPRAAGTAPPAGVAASAPTAPGQRRWWRGGLVALVALVRAAQLAGRGDEGTAAPAEAARAGAAAPDADDTAAGAVPALWIGMSA